MKRLWYDTWYREVNFRNAVKEPMRRVSSFHSFKLVWCFCIIFLRAHKALPIYCRMCSLPRRLSLPSDLRLFPTIFLLVAGCRPNTSFSSSWFFPAFFYDSSSPSVFFLSTLALCYLISFFFFFFFFGGGGGGGGGGVHPAYCKLCSEYFSREFTVLAEYSVFFRARVPSAVIVLDP